MRPFIRVVVQFVRVLCLLPLLSLAVVASDDPPPVPQYAAPSIRDPQAPSSGTTVTDDKFTGSLSLNVPIDVPGGINGMEPRLQINYRSAAASTWLGVGWDLNLGSIERDTKRGVDYSADVFLLRLGDRSSEIVRGDNGQFVTRIEGDFFRIRRLSSADSGEYWEVTSRDGVKYLFGTTTESRQSDPADKSRVFSWRLDRIEDTDNNFITLSYARFDAELYLATIEYTGHRNSPPDKIVKFFLENRPDAIDVYTTNFKVRTSYRLKSIAIFARDKLISAYKLGYDSSPSSGRTRLVSLQKFGRDAVLDAQGNVSGSSFLPAQRFGWQELSPLASSEILSGAIDSGFNEGRAWADMNGDGLADLCRVVGSTGDQRVRCLLSTPTGFGADVISRPVDWGFKETRFWVDVNGDGKADFCRSVGANGDFRVECLLSTGSGFGDEILSQPIDMGFLEGRAWVDFNGDGKADFCRVVGSSGDQRVRCLLSTGSGFGDDVISRPVDWGFKEARFWADVNGDGKADFCRVVGANGEFRVKCLLSTGNGFGDEILSPPIDTGFAAGRAWVDVNGDGKADFCRVVGADSDQHVRCLLSTGTGFGADIISDRLDWGFAETRFWADVDGDGKADFCRVVGANGFSGVKCLLSNGHGFGPDIQSGQIDPGFEIGRGWVDHDGDGKADFCRLVGGNPTYASCTVTGRDLPDLLQSAQNEFGGHTQISYRPSTEYSNTLLPFAIQTVASIVSDDGRGVSAQTTFNYSGGAYQILERDFRGFGHSIETKLANLNPNEQLVTESFYHQGNGTLPVQDDPLALGGVTKGKTYSVEVRSGTNVVFSRATTEYATSPQNIPAFNPPNVVDTFTCGVAGCTKHATARVTYDKYGNVVSQKQTPDVDFPDDTLITDRTFTVNEDSWILNKPSVETLRGHDPHVILGQTSFYYDEASSCETPSTQTIPSRGHLTRVVRFNDSGDSPEERMAYDDFGNMLCRRSPGGGVLNFGYDATGTLKLSVENALHQIGRSLFYGINNEVGDYGSYGQLAVSIDINSGQTSYKYDALGRMVEQRLPSGATSKLEYSDTGDPQKQSITVRPSSGLWSEVLYDGHSRAYKTRSAGPGDKVLLRETMFHPNGLASSTSEPRFESDPPQWVRLKYDALGRLTVHTSPDGSVSQNCYDLRTAIYRDPNGHSLRQIVNSWGRLASAEQFKGVRQCTDLLGSDVASYSRVEYRYDGLGRLIVTKDSKGNETHSRYNSLGQRVQMDDPDLGSWHFKYESDGRLAEQVDARGSSLSFTYDILGRVLTKSHQKPKVKKPKLDTTYTYDGPGGDLARGRLTKVVDGSGETSFTYDELGNEKEILKKIRRSTFRTDVTYDAANRLSSVRYPDAKTLLEYKYDGPFLRSVRDANRIYAEYLGHDALGRPTRVNFGNGVTSEYSYSGPNNSICPLANNRLCTIVTKSSSNRPLVDTYYEYDSVGNVKQVRESGRSTWYVYDELNRLLAVGDSAVQQLSYATIVDRLQNSTVSDYPSVLASTAPMASWTHTFGYDEIGNMTWNSDVGGYSYTGPQPHGVSSAGVKHYLYDANGNVTKTKGKELEFDYENRLATVENGLKRTHFKYDYRNERVERDSWTTKSLYVSDLYDCRTEYVKISKHCYKNIVVGGTVVARVDARGRAYYFHANYLSSVLSITDQKGEETARIKYAPFGAEKDKVKFGFNYRFTGQYYDEGADLYFYRSRFYDPGLGRFVSPDPVVSVIGNPQTLNRYTYGANNPINYVDPDGHLAWFVPIIAGAVLGGVNAAVHHGNILTGMAQGAIAGAFIAGAGALAPAGGGLGAVGVYSAAGAGAGATNAALWGGDVGRAALYGAVFGAVGYEASSLGQLNIFGNSTALGGTANYITTAAIRNSIMTGAIASYQGRDVGRAMLEGAMNGAISSAANTVIGHTLGIILAGTGEGSWYTDSQGRQAFLYLHGKGMGAITFGNVIVGDAGFLGEQREDGYLNLDHELSHVEQGMTLSVGYLFNPSPSNFFTFFGAHPWAMASSIAISGIGTGFTDISAHRYNVLECSWMEVPDCD